MPTRGSPPVRRTRSRSSAAPLYSAGTFNAITGALENLVETDSVYGHRRDIDGYAKAVSVFDRQLGELMAGMSEGDVVMITADHGCDPGFKGTDHTREYIPVIAWGKALKSDVDLGTREGFGDIAATILDIFGINADTIDGKSWKKDVLN